MFAPKFQINFKEPVLWFCFGWSLIILTPILPLAPHLQTFIHPWRPELAASLLFLISLCYLLFYSRDKVQELRLSRQEINFIVLPLLAFIGWSGLSVFWAPSWKSAFYHTLVWTEYLIFYLIARRILENKNGLQTFLLPLSAVLLIIGLPTIIEYLSFLIFGGATSLGLRYAKYGELFNTIFAIIIVAVLRLNGKKFLLGLLMVVSMWLFIISTLGRTNLILFVFGMMVITATIFVFKSFHKYRSKIATILLSVIFVPVLSHSIAFLNEEPNVPIVKRVSNETAISYSTDVRKFLKSVSLEMFYQNPMTGVGANNFGLQFNNYRVLYAERNPADVNLMTAEAEIAERSHNEYLQILAELGTVGFLIFLWFLSGIALMGIKLLMRMRRTSLFPFAALLGITFFLTSSFVSSFSFRLVQNGFVFFFVLAVASKCLFNHKRREKTNAKFVFTPRLLKFGFAAGIIACLLLTSYCLIRVTAAHYTYKAQVESEIETALPNYQKAFWLDEENPKPFYALGMDLFFARRYAEAVPYLRQAIDAQRATSIDYSYLASAYTLAGDNVSAEKTIAEALRLYPYSTFIRTRYATLLKENGKSAESAEQLKIALEINKREANTWWTLMNEGARAASLRAAQNKDFVAVMKLNPEAAIYAIVTEREIKFPEEKFKIKFDGD